MANYYTRFSAVLGELSTEEVAWIKQEIDDRIDADENSHLGFDYHLDGANPATGVRTDHLVLWINSGDGDGNVDRVAEFVQNFLKKFRPKEKWGMEWSSDCDKLRLGAFGGGAVVVSARDCTWINTGQWLSKKLEPRKPPTDKKRTEIRIPRIGYEIAKAQKKAKR